MSLAERIARAGDRFTDRTRSPQAGDVAEAAPTGSLEDLRRRKYCLLLTYKQDGEPVPSPVWFGTGNGQLYVQAGATSAKVRRIRRTPDVRVAPATSRGRPLGAPFVGTARVVPAEDEADAERWLQANYGLGRRAYSLLSGRLDNVYVEITPTSQG